VPPWDFASARGYDPSAPEKDLALSKLDNSSSMPKCVFVNEPFEWMGPATPASMVEDCHLRNECPRLLPFTPNRGVDHPGTYRGLMEKIPYLKTLGVTAVELMPVQEFNETSLTRSNPQTRQPLRTTGDTIL